MLLLVGKQTGVRSVYDRSVNLDALLPFCHCLRDTLVNKGSELKTRSFSIQTEFTCPYRFLARIPPCCLTRYRRLAGVYDVRVNSVAPVLREAVYQ